MLGMFFTITGDNVSTTLSYVSGLISDMTPLLLPIVAVGLGVIIFYAVIGAIKK